MALAVVRPTITPPIRPGPAAAAMPSMSRKVLPASIKALPTMRSSASTWARAARQALAAAQGFDPEQIAIEVIGTSGDRIQDRPLSDVGGKGLFTKEIEEALAAGAIDLAVHSSKDMPTALPPGLVLSAFMEREDARDAFISRKAKSIADLPGGAMVGTASLRRQAMVKRK